MRENNKTKRNGVKNCPTRACGTSKRSMGGWGKKGGRGEDVTD